MGLQALLVLLAGADHGVASDLVLLAGADRGAVADLVGSGAFVLLDLRVIHRVREDVLRLRRVVAGLRFNAR